ncbi:metalloprotease [Mycena crocata]|nr:metalloprotease [Mycena crocata]
MSHLSAKQAPLLHSLRTPRSTRETCSLGCIKGRPQVTLTQPTPYICNIFTTITLLLATSAVIAKPIINTQRSRNCGTHLSASNITSAERHFEAHRNASSDFKIANKAVNVYLHVISANSALSGGNIPDSQITNQINVLNTDYGAANIVWKLAGTTRTVNADWFKNVGPSTSQQTAMKNALGQDSKGDLNVYSVGFTSGSGAGLLGYSTYPVSYAVAPKDDGIVILYSSMLTHESGHWLGLYHTFQGGCGKYDTSTDSGDHVGDTPGEASGASGCPSSPARNTCVGAGFSGVDPIRNFMDYSSDACMTGFAAGHIQRATSQFAT